MPYEFSNKGISLFYADILNENVDLNTVTSAMQSNFRDFISNYFNVTDEQSDYISNIPDEILTNIANNLVHCLNNNYSISLDIDGFAKPFFNQDSIVPTWQTTRLKCHWGTWTSHENCVVVTHHGLGCSLTF